MKIYVVPRYWIEDNIEKNPQWHIGKWIISIFSEDSFSPLPSRYNILKLEFDDVTDRERETLKDQCIFFDKDHAKKIHEFIKEIKADDQKDFFVHCDAGVSRSGAVGLLLNEWFNKFKSNNPIDYEAFKMNNRYILPNPLVVRILKLELFGKPFCGIEVNDYSFNEDGERIDNIEII